MVGWRDVYLGCFRHQKKTPKGDLGNDWDSLCALYHGVSSSPPRHGIINRIAIVWKKTHSELSLPKNTSEKFQTIPLFRSRGRVHGEWWVPSLFSWDLGWDSCIHGYGIRTASGTHSNSRTEVDSVGFVWRFDDDDNMGMGTARTCKNYGEKNSRRAKFHVFFV